MAVLPPDLQSAFVESMGKPIPFGDEQIVQADRWELTGATVVEVRFLKGQIVEGQSARISIKKPGKISLSDGSFVSKVAVFDDLALPRFVRHQVQPNGSGLLVYNAYSVIRAGHQFDESWTGNAGMIVTTLSGSARRYECSSGSGGFNREDLVFDVEIFPGDANWLPEDIYD